MSLERKKNIRQAMERLLKMASLKESQYPSILEKMSRLPAWQKADLVLGYLSFRNEFPLDFLLRKALKEGKIVGVPRVEGHNLEFYRLSSLEQALPLNRWGIREPDPEMTDPIQYSPYSNPLILVPGTAFDTQKQRLGKGGGFYDRFFRDHPDLPLLKIGIGYACQETDSLPSEAHDVPMDEILLF